MTAAGVRGPVETVHVHGPLEALPWLARLTKEGPLVGCVGCGEGTTWGIHGLGGDPKKKGLHPHCVPTALRRGLLTAEDTTREHHADPSVAREAADWCWRMLAPWYDR